MTAAPGAPLRVLVVTVVHDPEDARIRYRQLSCLLDRGHRVSYAAPFRAYGRTVPAGVRGLDLPRAVGRRRGRALRAARTLLRTRGGEHDVVLLHDPELLLAAAPLRRGGRPVVVWDVHEDWPAAMSLKPWLPAGLRPLAAGAARRLQSWAESRVRLMLAEYGYADSFRGEHPVIPNTVPVPAEEPPPPGEDRAVYVGRLTRQRGALELLRLGELLAGEGVTVELVGNADGDVAPAVRAAADAGSVVWRGFLPNTEALRRLDGALAGLVLLHDEPNYGHSRFTKLMEYMAHGVPIVTTPNRAAVDLVEACGSGLVVPFGDPAAAADAVRRLRADRELRERLGRAGRAAAVAQFDWRRDGARFVDLLEAWAQDAAPPAPRPAR